MTFRFGQLCELFTMAARTRSLDSESAASGRPSRLNPGKPSAISTSTVTNSPFSPESAIALVVARLITHPPDNQSLGAMIDSKLWQQHQLGIRNQNDC